jgi:hypothetical protein
VTEDFGRQAFNTPAEIRAASRQRDIEVRRENLVAAGEARKAADLLQRAYDLIGAARDIVGDIKVRGLHEGKRTHARTACNASRESIMDARTALLEIGAVRGGGR